MDWLHLFTSFEGRISRQPFWLAWAVFIAFEIAIMSTIDSDRWTTVLDLVLTYPQFAVSAKRGHDRNTPTWVVGIFFALSVLFDLLLLAGLISLSDLSSQKPLAMIFAIPLVVFALVLIIDLGFRRGTAGPNRYGPDPLDAST